MLSIVFAILLSMQPGFMHAEFSPSDYTSMADPDPENPGYHRSTLGDQIFIFDPGMDMDSIQSVISHIHERQSGRGSEFNGNRYALMFKPGVYHVDIRVGYYTQVIGLGRSPEEVNIVGAVRSTSTQGPHVLTNFWRAVENLTIFPTSDSTNVWGVSQASPMRRVHIKGNLQLFDLGYASGGYLADSKIDGSVFFGAQQQWFTRNSSWRDCSEGAWNIFSMGVTGSPETNWPEGPYTSLPLTPVSREKPWLILEEEEFFLQIPEPREHSSGPSWQQDISGIASISLNDFYIARPGKDDAASINRALKEERDLLLTPGIYKLEESLKVTAPGTMIVGLGMPTLIPSNGNPAIEISDVDGVILSGILFDAGKKCSETLLRVGEYNSYRRHSEDPACLFDIFCRVGGASAGSTISCVEVNSHDVFMDHAWLWRADHGQGVGWDLNRCANGLVVNGDRVTVHGLFNEHAQEYQTLWKGDSGRVFFYQSEMPYDPPSVGEWSHDSTRGYASYKVGDEVKMHEAWGIGVYCFFDQAPIIVDRAIEAPRILEDMFHHKYTRWLNGNETSRINRVINQKGHPVHIYNRKSSLK